MNFECNTFLLLRYRIHRRPQTQSNPLETKVGQGSGLSPKLIRNPSVCVRSDASPEASSAVHFEAVSSILSPFFVEVCIEAEICVGAGDRGNLAAWLRRRSWSIRGYERAAVIAFGVRWRSGLRSPLQAQPILNWLTSPPSIKASGARLDRRGRRAGDEGGQQTA